MSNEFLLQTNNIQPLIKLIQDLNDRLEENQNLITSIQSKFDRLKFPANLDVPGPEEPEFDDLHQHIVNKYQIESIQTPDFNTNNERLNTLLSDNYRLLVIKRQNSKRNLDLTEILHNYQSFIKSTLIPSLRTNFLEQLSKTSKDFKMLMDHKHNLNVKVWSVYQQYITNLDAIFKVANTLDNDLKMLDSDELNKLEMKLIALESLVKHSRSQ